MKNKFIVFSIASIISLSGIAIYASKTEATCSGGANCKACSNCKYCKNCSKDGGTCSVCK